MTQLSENFTVAEFTYSETAARLGKEIVPTIQELVNMKRLCTRLLQPVRALLGKTTIVTSGLRPIWLNLAIGGSTKSAHIDGLAADLRVVGMTPAQFARWLQMNAEAEDWPIDQCILEFGRWVHLSTGDKPRMQFLTAKSVNGRTVYLNGIVE